MSLGNIQFELSKGTGMLTGSAARSSAQIADGEDEQVEVTVTGAALGDFVIAVSYSVDVTDINLVAAVSAANTVTVNFLNVSGGAITLGAGTVRVIVLKRYTEL